MKSSWDYLSGEIPVAEYTVCESQMDIDTKTFRTADILFDMSIGSGGSKVLNQMYSAVCNLSIM